MVLITDCGGIFRVRDRSSCLELTAGNAAHVGPDTLWGDCGYCGSFPSLCVFAALCPHSPSEGGLGSEVCSLRLRQCIYVTVMAEM